jgi:hypothetical protein
MWIVNHYLIMVLGRHLQREVRKRSEMCCFSLGYTRIQRKSWAKLFAMAALQDFPGAVHQTRTT